MTIDIQEKVTNILEEEPCCFRKTEKGWERLFDDALLTVELIETSDHKLCLTFTSDFLANVVRLRASGSKLSDKVQRRVSICEKKMRKRQRQINREKREHDGVRIALKMDDVDLNGRRLIKCSYCHKAKPSEEITFDDTPIFPKYICENCYRKTKKEKKNGKTQL